LKLADFANGIEIDPRKLTHYVLNLNSPRGKNKAILFEKILGYTKENYAQLLFQIKSKVLQAEAVFHSEDEFGKRYVVDLLIEGTQGQKASVRTGWLVSSIDNKAHLVTLFIKRGE
jgi:hypothetical protein